MKEGLQGPTPDTRSEHSIPRRGSEGAYSALTLFEVLSWIPDSLLGEAAAIPFTGEENEPKAWIQVPALHLLPCDLSFAALSLPSYPCLAPCHPSWLQILWGV